MNAAAKAAAKARMANWRAAHPNEPEPQTISDEIPGIELYNDATLATRTL
jgi:hypothetical protein